MKEDEFMQQLEENGAKAVESHNTRLYESGDGLNRGALEYLRRRFLAECPDFKTFLEPGAGWAQGEKNFKVVAAKNVQEAKDRIEDDAALGKAAYDILMTAASDGPLVRWQTADSIQKNHPEAAGDFYRVIGALLRSDDPTPEILSLSYDAYTRLRDQGVTVLTFGERINILFSALAMVRPMEAAPLKISIANKAGKQLVGENLLSENTETFESGYRRFAELFGAVFSVMRDEWNWAPQDWLDVQAFLWIALKSNAVPEVDPVILPSDNSEETNVQPTNLILYGPPGTGKTYASAAEAVRLCGEDVPSDRVELMKVYNRLCDEKRIEFVTFHQSMSYEDFVEGKQPVTGGDDERAESAGFRLETVPGIFRRIARRAETSHGRTTGDDAVLIDERRVFKTSIGEANNPEDAHLFEEAISGDYTLLGYEDIDWSDQKYAERDAIIAACNDEGELDGNPNAMSGRVQMPFIFRNWVEPGDILIVSKGNGLFRAIGEVEGDYEFRPRPEGGYAHRRAVRWLWVDREGVPVSEIYKRNFSQRTIYLLTKDDLNVPALERYMNSGGAHSPLQQTAAEQFVLIIDEINRANISKVFGELITLLEPDKRLGQPNQIRVRLPYSEDEFGVPANLHIVGTMNTADRSIALLDTALRRRFEFRELAPDPSILRDTGLHCDLDLPGILTSINERIEYLFDREHRIGHAYFVNCGSRAEVDAVMRFKVIPLLAEYFFEDWGKVAAVLGDAASHEGPVEGGFLNRAMLKPPPGLDSDDDAPPRFRWSVRSEDEGFDYTKLLGP